VAGGQRIFPVILSGGAGTRLWPLSRESSPKQLLRLTAELTLLQQAALRILDAELFAPVIVIASAEHRYLIAEQLREIGIESPTIVLEPAARNTAAAAAVAALMVGDADPDALLLLMPADHRIGDADAFRRAVSVAEPAARLGYLSLFGVRPDRPATGYGYIHLGESIADSAGVNRVAAFVEKPDAATAARYLAEGEHLWNSGIFLLPVGTFLSEFERHEPELLGHARRALGRAERSADFVRLDADSFGCCRATSIDYAVMERTDRAAVVPVDFEWSDVGSWKSLLELAGQDAEGNAVIGEVFAEETRNSYLRSEGPLVATIGVENLIVVATPDAVLVAHKDRDQEIRKIVERLRGGNHGRI
jgi:mannose-1-phosphate guanylyltransferase / mannose-6-phosphate isomerase